MAKDFRITAIVVDEANNSVSVTWKSRPGKQYKVLYSSSLAGDPRAWADLTDSYDSQGEFTTFVDTSDMTSVSQRFFAIEELP